MPDGLQRGITDAESTANQVRFTVYQQHGNALKRQGKSKASIDAYSRAVRRIAAYFNRCPERLSAEDLKVYFDDLLKTHSWSTIKLDRNGLQFFYKHLRGLSRNISAIPYFLPILHLLGPCLYPLPFVFHD
jgi:hypothetical protein